MDKAILHELAGVVGAENIFTDAAHLTCYSYDAAGAKALPDVVVRPANTTETAAVLRIANEDRVPVYPRGAATGMSGGSVPIHGGIALSLCRMNRIVNIDKRNGIAVAEPGVVLTDFQKAVETQGFFYPPDPASADFCTLGGNVAECAGGLRCIKYGVTRDYVLSLELVLPSGEVIVTGRNTLKSVSGYDLTRLLVGSEGTLGVVTRITVRLIPLPQAVATLGAMLRSDGEALDAALEIACGTPLPRAVEFIDTRCLEAIFKYQGSISPAGKLGALESASSRATGTHDPASGRKQGSAVCSELLASLGRAQDRAAFLLIEYDGGPHEIREAVERARSFLEARGAAVRAADSERARTALWDLRRSVSPALYSNFAHKFSEDICVPRSALQTVLVQLRQIEMECEVPVAVFGHVGDGNLHVNLLVEAGVKETEPRVQRAIRRVLETSILNDGTLSGEHGIGIAKAACMPLEFQPAELELMRQLKKLFDPNGIMNPGKMFPS
jgi:glycolate oxidase